ncbi:type IV toxin-antitoxin system AbiEi family antitoxin domain-containing protein [Microbacterium sp. LRZ72]|uniref:type IV toxin-antitoxin system AbiEi family antitoxin domain-containing protein n=1 Tax=Microbacterium sp. LRZ72 TaxID=2942481 RepID=UPI0029BBA33A|nr:type IV toxin-antitoxin system AbiEi family antitoxin domain-containing protein [Microbacterium sp. LRZ72]MDX2377622.1 type IV toxin-antitoxin system AbiEi family antitoxin domain-containing protein [Microbacterium sp. LRZ72]
MGVTGVVARVSELTARQWGLLTTAQAEAEGITRLQLARLAEAGVIERVERGIYAAPGVSDSHTPLRAAWLSLAPGMLAEERLTTPTASGVVSHTSAAALHKVGDLLDDEPEVTVPRRKQSRRGIRLHRGALAPDEVTIVEGLPVTTPERTVADLLRDGHDPAHIADIAGEILRRGLATRDALANALDPLAQRNGQPTGAALLEQLLDLVGLSVTALAKDLATSDLGKALVTTGQLGAIRSIIESVSLLDPAKNPLGSLDTSAIAAMMNSTAVSASFPEGILPKIDLSTIAAADRFAAAMDTEAFRSALQTSVPAWLPELIRSIPAESWPRAQLATAAERNNDEVST